MANRKCQQCSKLTAEEARERHQCWNEATCHSTRSYYRNRSQIQQKRRQSKLRFEIDDNSSIDLKEAILAPTDRSKIISFSTDIPEYNNRYTAVLRVYRETLNSPVKAIDAIIYKGNLKEAEVEAIDCSRMTASQINTYLQRLLAKLKELYSIDLFSSQQELSPSNLTDKKCL